MKRIVREESGASSLLKFAPVRATVTARSGVFAAACNRRYTPRIVPFRSTTAIASVGSSGAEAPAVRMERTSDEVRGAAAELWASERRDAVDAKTTERATAANSARNRREGRIGRRVGVLMPSQNRVIATNFPVTARRIAPGAW